MQAYQSPPCPYCGITWNPPGAQACANCRNGLPPAPPAYAPPGYAPPGYAPSGQQPGPDPNAPAGYPGYSGYPGPQAPPYGAYPPAGYPQNPAYPQAQQYGQFQTAAPAGASTQAATATPAGTALPLFGRTLSLPFVVPLAVLRYQRALVPGVGGALLLAVLILGVVPAVAAAQITGAQQAVRTTVSHQPKVDAAFAKFFTPSQSNDPNAEQAALQQQAKSVSEGLASVQADEAALRSADQRLSLLQVIAWTKGAPLATERHRLSGALAGLQQADQALTAAVNEANVALPYLDALIDYTRMGAALGKHDLVGAAAPYPDAQQKMETALSLDHATGLPPAIARQVSSFNEALNGTESLIQALQAKDAAGIKKANDAIQAAVKAMGSPAESVPSDYESKTFMPMQKGYDNAIKALKS